ncbi:hypothetical protein [Mesoterricola sediminis]|uniref:Uncharacterized protein n=1 Tax=Mesoterricola sediminis TaxID=2927980 RepID=A0AA48GWU5_9BACT|nr:hypothetical protein [Mesoterricola sediminis]BDU77125.1 hypothetical protein METESE_20830 [Mesoterricola sediminis]
MSPRPAVPRIAPSWTGRQGMGMGMLITTTTGRPIGARAVS